MKRAEAVGVFPDFIRRYRKNRSDGVEPHAAADRALRESVTEGRPGRAAEIIMLRKGRA